jgi:predicted metal-dependent peptidase
MINKLTLQTIREILYAKLGSASYIAGIIKTVVETKDVQTLAISKVQTLYYNPEFLKANIKSEEHLFTVLMHEIFHPLFGHFNIQGDQLSNIAQDAFINAALYHMFPFETDRCSLMKSLYNKNGIEGLLRPDSNLDNTRYQTVYKMLYTSYNKVSSSEVMEILEQTLENQKINVTLLGNHGESIEDGDNEIQNEIKAKVSEELSGKIKKAGHNSSVIEALVEVLNIHLTLKNDVLRKFAVKRTFDNFLDKNEIKHISRSPFPLNPSRTDLFMLMLGYDVIFYNNIITDCLPEKSGKINIYLDVSGSVSSEIPQIVGLMRNIKSKIEKIYLFSNACVEVGIEEVAKGNIATTYGTSFDCVAKSILENDIKKALIFTDGYAYLNHTYITSLKEKKVDLMVVLFCDGQLQYGTFQTIAEVVKLGDITC